MPDRIDSPAPTDAPTAPAGGRRLVSFVLVAVTLGALLAGIGGLVWTIRQSSWTSTVKTHGERTTGVVTALHQGRETDDPDSVDVRFLLFDGTAQVLRVHPSDPTRYALDQVVPVYYDASELSHARTEWDTPSASLSSNVLAVVGTTLAFTIAAAAGVALVASIVDGVRRRRPVPG